MKNKFRTTAEDPMDLNSVVQHLKNCESKLATVDPKGYIITFGIYGSTAKDTRTKKSPVDIYVFLDPKKIKTPLVGQEYAKNSLFGVPNEDWEPIRMMIVEEFGINPHTRKPYIINVVSEYEIKNRKDDIMRDLLIFKNGQLRPYRAKSVSENILFENTMLEYPQVRQSTTYSCGAAVIQSILAYYGKDVREKELIVALKTTKEDGTNPSRMIHYLKQQGLDVKFNKMTIVDIKKYIDQKIPVIVLIQAWADNEKEYDKNLDNGHYVVCIGYTNDKIYFEDPSIFERGYLNFDEFIKRWKDVSNFGKIYKQYGIAVYGEEPKYKDDLFEKIK